ncbi:hypothetical protein [Parafrankia sp. BMG5.11]|uniref:hypothetical protein n=1 Tax=Parafrankia sp. BMG5.11 TaxID=222540 RepID=UPI001FB1CC9A|nr:hypothetical protein [Parafrankia sp. BMG5.11]
MNYVIVGGVGARLQGSPNITGDLDIVPEPTPDNLARLAAAISGPSTQKKAPVDSAAFDRDRIASTICPSAGSSPAARAWR